MSDQRWNFFCSAVRLGASDLKLPQDKGFSRTDLIENTRQTPRSGLVSNSALSSTTENELPVPGGGPYC